MKTHTLFQVLRIPMTVALLWLAGCGSHNVVGQLGGNGGGAAGGAGPGAGGATGTGGAKPPPGPMCTPVTASETTCSGGVDDDCDGFTDCLDTDCDGQACGDGLTC